MPNWRLMGLPDNRRINDVQQVQTELRNIWRCQLRGRCAASRHGNMWCATKPASLISSKSTASSFNLIGGKTVTPPSSPNPSPRWTREQIRAARQVPLVPLLQKRGVQIIPREAGNFILPAYPGLIVKDSYWRWPERNLAGNAIDFFMRVLGLSFHDAMRQITAP